MPALTDISTDVPDSLGIVLLVAGFALSAVFILFGVLVDRYKKYHLIAGYNRASEAQKRQYDVEGLAKHLGDGLITLGVLLMLCSLFLYFRLDGWFLGGIGVFLFVVLLMLLGTPKFLPRRQALAISSPADAKHPFLHRVLPTRAYRAIERGTREWLIECGQCAHKRDLWEAGGVRHKGAGEPRKWNHCQQCQQWSWNVIRKKSPQERLEL